MGVDPRARDSATEGGAKASTVTGPIASSAPSDTAMRPETHGVGGAVRRHGRSPIHTHTVYTRTPR